MERISEDGSATRRQLRRATIMSKNSEDGLPMTSGGKGPSMQSVGMSMRALNITRYVMFLCIYFGLTSPKVMAMCNSEVRPTNYHIPSNTSKNTSMELQWVWGTTMGSTIGPENQN